MQVSNTSLLSDCRSELNNGPVDASAAVLTLGTAAVSEQPNDLKKHEKTYDNHGTSTIFRWFPHSKNIKNQCTSANSMSTSPWTQLQMSHWSSTERGHVGLPARKTLLGVFTYLTLGGKPLAFGPVALCFFITGGYSQSINYPDLNITQKIMASS